MSLQNQKVQNELIGDNMGLFEDMGIRTLKPNEALEIPIDAEWLEYMKKEAREKCQQDYLTIGLFDLVVLNAVTRPRRKRTTTRTTKKDGKTTTTTTTKRSRGLFGWGW